MAILGGIDPATGQAKAIRLTAAGEVPVSDAADLNLADQIALAGVLETRELRKTLCLACGVVAFVDLPTTLALPTTLP